MGVTAPILSTADNAFTFQPREADRGWLAREWPRAAGGVVGLAMVDFSLFPAVMRPWGPRERCYKWPYYFSSSPARTRSSEMLARGYASLADHVVSNLVREAIAIGDILKWKGCGGSQPCVTADNASPPRRRSQPH